MKRMIAAGSLLALSGCAGQRSTTIGLDAKTRLVMQVEGAQAQASGYSLANGGPVHRVVQGNDGKILFQYDLGVEAEEGGTYRFLLKPAAGKPTFAATREVTVMPKDVVRVELMEQPGTGRKVVDVFSLEPEQPSRTESLGDHLIRVHNAFFRWVHGN